MRASEHLQAALTELGQQSSPWRPGLVLQLRHLITVATRHEDWAETETVADAGPRETALGHKPRGVTVAGHSVQTDAALTALACSD